MLGAYAFVPDPKSVENIERPNGSMLHDHIYASISHNFLKLAIRNRIADVKENSIKDGAFGKMSPFEIDRHPVYLIHLCTPRR